ncbi:hypothetical protein K402DRAFT_401012 [Aulographum hederae CBS 113979]|uniref:TRAPP complex protein TRS85 n=1 Tax=Aulographum hederae CBS 113979 TaxID=1176131 RepID=A0A6G1HCB9_9PEZI|nr:hypothetical protein K402DRAFT_401012 [Aulographum hederae CBS 113979]
MTSPPDVDPLKSPPAAESPAASIVLPKRRHSPSASLASLPYRRSNQSLSTLFASTSSLSKSRPSSGTATPTPSAHANSPFSPGPSNGASSPLVASQGRPDEPRNLILRSFVPHVGVLASVDTEEMLQEKGFPGGLLQLVRPFGELIPGKVTIRDSIGSNRSWEDFGVRFTGLKDGLKSARRSLSGRKSTDSRPDSRGGALDNVNPAWLRTGGDITQTEEVVDRHLSFAELQQDDISMDYLNHKEFSSGTPPASSPFHALYLRRLLSALPLSPHETFSHPVACVIAISSRCENPIEELRRLYGTTNTGDLRLPQWVDNSYLRYYVLVHDEDHDDVAKSTSLYQQMTRHFGLHCHMLRIRSNECLPSDDDSVRLPSSEWISSAEELAEIQRRETSDDVDDPTPCLFESDATAIRTFVRELVVQSVIPSMERLSAQWNEQVASRRRGLSGRFMSLSKKWTPFGSSSRNSSGPMSLNSGSNSNYDSLQGFYRPDAPEATMRKLADYAFMLRDFKLAQSTYDILRSDFNSDKAWKHYAGANEMAAISTLLNVQGLTNKTRTESIDQMLETATYSYTTRCMAPYYALRTLALGLELLRLRGSSAADDAARWGSRILEAGLVGPVGHAIFTERISACYASRKGIGSGSWGSRKRKSGLLAMLAADQWAKLGKYAQAEKALKEAKALYGVADSEGEGKKLPFDGMQMLSEELDEVLSANRMGSQEWGEDTIHPNDEPPVVEEVSEELETKPHRQSLIGVPAAPFAGLEATPLTPTRMEHAEPAVENQFEATETG